MGRGLSFVNIGKNRSGRRDVSGKKVLYMT
jgi:hypothetical protein